ncbi:hypothetical protein [Sphingomonas faeni]|uniref:hypothetical protein n=1 Tax=Sphingomonas faeni TaxID=185950 RepID=UPI00334C1488
MPARDRRSSSAFRSTSFDATKKQKFALPFFSLDDVVRLVRPDDPLDAASGELSRDDRNSRASTQTILPLVKDDHGPAIRPAIAPKSPYCKRDASSNALRVDLQRALCFTPNQFPSFLKIAWSLPDEHP